VNPTILWSSTTTADLDPNLPDWLIAACVLRSIQRTACQRWFAKATRNFAMVDARLPAIEFAFAGTLSESTSATKEKPVHTRPKPRSNHEASQTPKLGDYVLNSVRD
jgi:hypothetical protein